MTKDELAVDFYFNFKKHCSFDFELVSIILKSDINIYSKIKIIESKISDINERTDFSVKLAFLIEKLYLINLYDLNPKEINIFYNFLFKQLKQIKNKLSINSISAFFYYFCYMLEHCLCNNINFKFKKEILNLVFKSLKKYYCYDEIIINYLGDLIKIKLSQLKKLNYLLFSNREFIDYFLKLKKYKYFVNFNLFKDFLSEKDKLIIFDKYKNNIFTFHFYPTSKLSFYESEVIKTIIKKFNHCNYDTLIFYKKSYEYYVHPSWIKECIDEEIIKYKEIENNIKDILE